MLGKTDIRYETKYLVENRVLLHALLDNYYTPDQQYPLGYIFNVHFDTLDLRAYEEKKAGDLSKSKLRARWYSESAELTLPTAIKVENKRKQDRLVTKHSLSLTIKAASIFDLLDPFFWEPLFQNKLPAGNLVVTRKFYPVLISGYRRQRYIDPMTGARISLDEHIQSYAISPLLTATNENKILLPQTILEVKSGRSSCPQILANFNCMQEHTFSKYASLLSEHLQGRE